MEVTALFLPTKIIFLLMCPLPKQAQAAPYQKEEIAVTKMLTWKLELENKKLEKIVTCKMIILEHDHLGNDYR